MSIKFDGTTAALPLVGVLSGALYYFYRQNQVFLEEIERCSIVPNGIKSTTCGLIRRGKHWLFRRNIGEPWMIVKPTTLVETPGMSQLMNTMSCGVNKVLMLPKDPASLWNFGGWEVGEAYTTTGPESILTDFHVFEHVLRGKEPPGATGVGYSDLEGKFVPCGGGSRFVEWLIMAAHQSLDPAFALNAHLAKAVLERGGIFAQVDLTQCEVLKLINGPWRSKFNATGFDLVAYKIPAPVWAKLGIKTLSVKHLCFDATANLVVFGNPEGTLVQSHGVVVENPKLESSRGLGSYTANTDACFSGFPVFSKADATWKFHGVHTCGDAYKTGCNHFVNCYAVLWLLKRTGAAMQGSLINMLQARCESKEGNRKMRAWLAAMRQLEKDEQDAIDEEVAAQMLWGSDFNRDWGIDDVYRDARDYYDPYDAPEGPKTAHIKVTQTLPPKTGNTVGVQASTCIVTSTLPAPKGRKKPKVVKLSIYEDDLPKLKQTFAPEHFTIYDEGEELIAAAPQRAVRPRSRERRPATRQALNVYDLSTGDSDDEELIPAGEGPLAPSAPPKAILAERTLQVKVPSGTRVMPMFADQSTLQSARNPDALPYCRFVQSKVSGVKTWKDDIPVDEIVHKYESTQEIVEACPPIAVERDAAISKAFTGLKSIADFEAFSAFSYEEVLSSTFLQQYVRDHLARTMVNCGVTLPSKDLPRTNPVCMVDKDGLPCFIRRATIGSGSKVSSEMRSLDPEYLDALRAIGEPMDNTVHGSDFVWPPQGPLSSDESLRYQSTEVGRHDLSQATSDPSFYEGMFQQSYSYKLLAETNLANAIESLYDTTDGTKSQGFTSYLKTGAKSAWLNTSESRQELTYFVVCRIALRTAVGSAQMLHMTPMQLVNRLLNDPCVASTKGESHNSKKATRRAWRQILIPAFVDAVILTLLSVEKNKADIASWDQGLQHRSCVGLGHHDAGIQRIGKMLEWVAGSNGRIYDEDASAWDLTQSRDILLLTADARVYGLETDRIGIMSELIYQVSACNTAVCVQIGKFIWESQRFGMTITGCNNTSEQNTRGRDYGAQLCGARRVGTLGDDLAGDGITDKEKLKSFGVRSKIEEGKETGSPVEGPHDFTSHRFTRDVDGVWHAEFLNFRKLLANLRFRSSPETPPTKEQLGGVKFAVRHNPAQLKKLELLSDMLGWGFAAAIAAPCEDLG